MGTPLSKPKKISIQESVLVDTTKQGAKGSKPRKDRSEISSDEDEQDDPYVPWVVDALKEHESIKQALGRGSETQSQLSAVTFLSGLEREMLRIQREMDQIRTHLNVAWVWLDDSRNFRKCSTHMDQAQQRLHKVIKKLAKRKK